MKAEQKKLYFPLYVDLSKKKIVIVGGGKIASRRIETLLDFSDHIMVIAPEVTERLEQLSQNKQIRWMKDSYHEEVIEGADLVLAATNDEACNVRVVEDCRARNIPVNTSHKKELCDFYFPGILCRENLVMGFCSGGQNHRKVKETREKIEEIFYKL